MKSVTTLPYQVSGCFSGRRSFVSVDQSNPDVGGLTLEARGWKLLVQAGKFYDEYDLGRHIFGGLESKFNFLIF